MQKSVDCTQLPLHEIITFCSCFAAVFSGTVLIGLNFVILSFDLSSSM